MLVGGAVVLCCVWLLMSGEILASGGECEPHADVGGSRNLFHEGSILYPWLLCEIRVSVFSMVGWFPVVSVIM